MKVFLREKTENGKQALKGLLELKTRASIAQKLGLKAIRFNAQIIREIPFTLSLDLKHYDRIPYTPFNADQTARSLEGLFLQMNANLEDIEVICE